MPNTIFDNTEYAFAYRSDFELKRAYYIFKLINNNWLVKTGTSLATKMMDMGLTLPVVIGMRPTIYSVFCGGDELDDAIPIIKNFGKYGVDTVLDYGVEAKETDEDFDKTALEIKNAINFAAKNKHVPIVCSKFTGLLKFAILEKRHAQQTLSPTEEKDYQKALKRIYGLAAHAAEKGVSLFVDAEESWIQQPLDDLTFDLMKQYNTDKPIIYNTVQLYRKDRWTFLQSAHQQAKQAGFIYAVKIVRGAYMEKEAKRAEKMGYENPIQTSKANTDTDYNKALEYAIENLDTMAVCVATHNEESCRLAVEKMEQKKIAKDHPHIHFSQLMGMSDHLSFNLAKMGFKASKYMPYGPVKDVIPYLIRRAQENTSVSGQMGRELQLIHNEIKRRKV